MAKDFSFSPFDKTYWTGKKYIANLIEMYTVDWVARGKFIRPKSLRDAADFLVTEVGEVIEAVLRQEPGYVRNNDREVDLGSELADVVIMAYRTARIAGVDLTEAIEAKLDKMDAQRLDTPGDV